MSKDAIVFSYPAVTLAVAALCFFLIAAGVPDRGSSGLVPIEQAAYRIYDAILLGGLLLFWISNLIIARRYDLPRGLKWCHFAHAILFSVAIVIVACQYMF